MVTGEYRIYGDANQEGCRREGRPRFRWMDDVELDLRNMDVKSGGREIWTEQNELLS
jgi:hypothetical protein